MTDAEAQAGGAPFEIVPGGDARLLLLCDHAANALPPGYGTLGLPESELARHIAYDIGAAAVTRALAARLGAPAILTRYSRLLIDPNRGEDDPTLVMRLSDGAIVPGNARTDGTERAARIAAFHRPYHAAIDARIDAALGAGIVPALVSVHSFTPAWKGVARPWHVGVLWDRDPRLPCLLLDALSADPALVVGDNEPYRGTLRGDTMFRHGTGRGLAHALVEIRQDLIADEAGAGAWAARLADLLGPALGRQDLHQIRHFGSTTEAFATGEDR